MTKFLMRFVGVVNLLFVGLGICYAIAMRADRLKAGKWPPYSAVPLDWLLYFAFLASCIALMMRFSYLSVRLIRADRKALLPTCILFGVQIAFVLVTTPVFWLITPEWVTKRHWFWIQGWDLAAPQIAFGYVFVGLTACLLLLLTTRPRKHAAQTVASLPS
jgi:hypothetical protein